jgi:hypothetical protein
MVNVPDTEYVFPALNVIVHVVDVELVQKLPPNAPNE